MKKIILIAVALVFAQHLFSQEVKNPASPSGGKESKKLAVVLPMYYLPANNVWIISGGVGYKF